MERRWPVEWSPKKKTLNDMLAMDTDGNTLPPEMFKKDTIGETESIQIDDELKEMEQLMDNAFEQQHHGQPIEAQTNKKDKKSVLQAMLEKQVMEKLQPQHLTAIKEKDPVMFQLLETFRSYAQEMKSASKASTSIDMKELKQHLYVFIEISAKRQQILMSDVKKKKEKLNFFRIIAKLVKLIWKKSGQKDEQKGEKAKEKEKLRIMYSLVDSIDETIFSVTSGQKKKQKRRRKKSIGIELAIFALSIIVLSWLLFGLQEASKSVYRKVFKEDIAKQQMLKAYKALDMLPGHEKYEEDARASEDVCAVCLSVAQNGEEKTLSCGHRFHKECIDLWYSSKRNTCPKCYAKIPSTLHQMLMEPQ